jgi:hypothetical protein
MTKPPKRPRDPNQLAKAIVDLATGEGPTQESKTVIRARKAGSVGGVARAKSLTAVDRSEIARIAASARWKKSD